MNVFDVLREKLKEKSELYRREEEIQKANPCYQIGVYAFKANGYENAIEIVNQVEQEYNNDFCEWTEHETEIDVYFTKCGQAHIFVDGTPEENNHEFCPYCGKKIKVVE